MAPFLTNLGEPFPLRWATQNRPRAWRLELQVWRLKLRVWRLKLRVWRVGASIRHFFVTKRKIFRQFFRLRKLPSVSVFSLQLRRVLGGIMFFFFADAKWAICLKDSAGNTKGEVSLYHWPPVWLVWKQLYDYWQFLFLFAKQTNPNQSNRRSTVQWYFPLKYSLDSVSKQSLRPYGKPCLTKRTSGC